MKCWLIGSVGEKTGSKGYSCCKRRVLEFDQFLRISGCSESKHLFIGAPKPEVGEELVTCRYVSLLEPVSPMLEKHWLTCSVQ